MTNRPRLSGYTISQPWLGAAVVYGAVTTLVTHPLIFQAGTVVSSPIDDPLLNTWILWWNTQEWPLTAAWWNAPMFYPTDGTMAFSELLLGLVPITAPVQSLFHNPVLAYNIAVLVSFPLCALAAHALALELTGRHDAALLAGLAFGFSPYRANEFGHVQMLSYYWAPVVLFALHRYRRTRHWTWLMVFAAAWLMQSLCNGYALFHLAVLIVLWLVWFSGSLRDVFAVSTAWVCGSLPLIPILMKYQEIHAFLHLERSINDIRRFSADVSGLLSAPPEAVLLGDRLVPTESNALFPGMTIVIALVTTIVLRMRNRAPAPITISNDRIVLALIGILCAAVAVSAAVIGPWKVGPLTVTDAHKPLTLALWAGLFYFARGPRWRRVWSERSVIGFYALATVTFYVLSFGPEPRLLGSQVVYKPPYAWLLELPGFDSIRTPVRFAMPAVLCLAVLVALAYARWLSRNKTSDGLICIALSAGLIADGWIKVRTAPVPSAGPAERWPSVAAVIELPLRPDTDTAALYRSMTSGLPIVNGASGYSPPHYYALTHALTTGDVSVIKEFSRFGRIGISIDRMSSEGAAIEDAVLRLDAVASLTESSGWSRFVVGQTGVSQGKLGLRLPVRSAQVNRNAHEIERLLDDRIETMWSSGTQDGHEELLVELDASQIVGGVVLEVGSCPFGFPRDLAIETSRDGRSWNGAWRGRTAIATVRAALDDPANVPIQIQFGAVEARFIRLRQLGQDLAVPWCVAELAIHEPS